MKTKYSEKKITQIVKNIYPNAKNMLNMIEGDTSQTYYFETEDKKLVIQTSKDIQGYKKEAYIYKLFSQIINVRKVLKMDKVENDIYYCITEYIDAKRLQDLESKELTKNVKYIMKIFKTLAEIKIPENIGFGYFNSEGIANFKTWVEYINAVIYEYQWSSVDLYGKGLTTKCIDEIKKYNNILDNKKSLIHGDFGSSNVLNNDDYVYLIDWGLSLYGDPLYEVANVLFWNENCLIPLIDEIKKEYLNDENTIIRIYIYILRIGLEEIYRTIQSGSNSCDNKWVKERIEEIVYTFIN